jgi:hypothetical protein
MSFTNRSHKSLAWGGESRRERILDDILFALPVAVAALSSLILFALALAG